MRFDLYNFGVRTIKDPSGIGQSHEDSKICFYLLDLLLEFCFFSPISIYFVLIIYSIKLH